MAETPKMKKSKVSYYTTPKSKQLDDHLIEPLTPHISTPTPRRSLRLSAATPDPTPRRNAPPPLSPTTFSITPASPQPTEYKRKRKLQEKRVSADFEKKRESRSGKCSNAGDKVKKRVYYKKVVYDGGEFSAGDDVYVKRREDACSDNDDPEVEECRVCFKPAGRRIMIECDDCLNGFHLKCLKPPLKAVPDGDWICNFCEAKKSGEIVKFPEPPEGKKRSRTAREKLLSSDLWAAHIENLWKAVDDTYWFRARWYIIPEETAMGRQPHNLRRELYRTNDFADVEMESIIRHCFVMTPKEFSSAGNEGDDVFLCEYEYDILWHNFKRIAEVENTDNGGEEVDDDDDWNSSDEVESASEDEIEYENEKRNNLLSRASMARPVAANLRKGRIFGLQKIGAKKIPEHLRCHKQTDLEKAKATLLLATLPQSLPCRDKEMDEITTFIKGAICDEQCLGRCLYIHGVPGTGKTMSVLAVMRNLKAEVDAGSTRPYCFVEINGLKLASPENKYSVIYEGLSAHRVGWKKAENFLNERFSDDNKRGKDTRPCILLIDELDVLVTRNQSVLYNILDTGVVILILILDFRWRLYLKKQEFSLTKQKTALLQAADSIGKKIQYHCPGFLPNKRQALCDSYCGENYGSTDFDVLENVREAILRMTYYWYNFMPLSRGSAVIGLVVMLGLLLAANMEFTGSIPEGLQVDWEAILESDPNSFISFVKSWLYPSLKILSRIQISCSL